MKYSWKLDTAPLRMIAELGVSQHNVRQNLHTYIVFVRNLDEVQNKSSKSEVNKAVSGQFASPKHQSPASISQRESAGRFIKMKARRRKGKRKKRICEEKNDI